MKKYYDLNSQVKEEEDILNELIQIGENSLLLFSQTGKIYQVIKGSNSFYFLYVGNEIKGVNYMNLRSSFTDEAAYLKGKKDYKINKSDISKINLDQKHSCICPFAQGGHVRISVFNRIRKFVFIGDVDILVVAKFFQTNTMAEVCLPNKLKSSNDEWLPDEMLKKLPHLRLLGKTITIISCMLASEFLLATLFFKIPAKMYTMLTVACLIMPLLLIYIYIKNNPFFTLAEKKRHEKENSNRFELSLILILTSSILWLRTSHFNILKYEVFILFCTIIAIVYISLFFLLSKEYKIKKLAIITFIFAVLMYTPSSTLLINDMFDMSTPTNVQVSVIDKSTSRSKNSTRYYMKVKFDDNNIQKLRINSNTYYKLEEGTIILIKKQKGFLNIPYIEW